MASGMVQPAAPHDSADADAGAGGRAAARIAGAYLGLVAAFAVAMSIAGLRARLTVPVRDDWRILDDMFARPSLAAWVWADHNGHRMAGAKLLVYLDYVWLQGRMLLPVAVSIACTWLAAAALAASFGREARGATARLTLGFALFTLFWSVCSYDFTWGLEASAVTSATATLLAVAAFAAWVVRSRTQRPAAGFLLLALGAATLATYSHGPGLSVWPTLLAIALLFGVSRRMLALVAGTALVAAAVYVTGLRNARAGTSYGNLLLHHVVELCLMSAAYVGAPPTRALAAFSEWSAEGMYAVSRWIGALAIAAAAGRAYELARAPGSARTRDVLGIGLMAASATSGALMTLNRFPFSKTAIDIRFTTWMGLFWVGLACTLPRPSRPATGRRAGAGAVLVVALSALMLPGLHREWTRRSVEADTANEAALLHLLGIQWDPLAGGPAVGPSPARSYRVVAHLRADHRSMFAEPHAAWLGSRLHDRFVVVPRTQCHADVLWHARIGPQTGLALRVAGTTSEAGRNTTPAVVFTDEQDVIRGLALHVAQLEPFLEQSFLPVEHGWLGAVANYDPTRTYTVNLVRADGRSVCRGPVVRERE